jgi:hypothetical protein
MFDVTLCATCYLGELGMFAERLVSFTPRCDVGNELVRFDVMRQRVNRVGHMSLMAV